MFIFVYRLAMDAKTRKGDGGADWKYPSLLERFSGGHSIYGSQETSCIKHKGFLMFLSYGTDRGSRSSRGSKGSNPFNPSNPSNPW